ncbi:O-methyltransferase family protein [Anaerovibrio sp. JC8]|uniref:O-methyltransferase n=1 Tax=Anaerovibrio sp. JC8 TaxID=1240085 RepID=UPI000A0DF365|nr:O-methyltransferase [Anaerovibrio sp. JC8]ORT98955.1 O-methyltransferase family protein [Anaerovibrio sp. JC8]
MDNFAALIAEMEEYGRANHVPIINEKGMPVLLEVVRDRRPHRVLEIGTAIGYSGLLIANNAADDVEIDTLELSEERAAVARAYIDRSMYKDRIKIHVGDAGENILKLTGKYDFVFIDAAKGQYPDYFRKIYPLLTEDAMVLADNVLFRGYVRGDVECPRRFRTIVKRLREYIALVSENNEFETVIREDGDGLAVSRRLPRENNR